MQPQRRRRPADFAQRRSLQLDFRDHRVDRFVLYPKHWNDFSIAAPFTWQRVKFDSASLSSVPADKKGVYSFVAEPGIAAHPLCGYLLYVGMVATSNFRQRLRSYLDEPNKKKPREHVLYMIDRWKSHLWFYYSVLDATVPIPDVEAALLTALLPPVNRQWPAHIAREMRLTFS